MATTYTYDPDMGRFINADDVAYLGADGTTSSYNLFAYCMNNPSNRYDNGGTFSFLLAVAIVGAVIGAVSQMVTNVRTGNEWHEGVAAASEAIVNEAGTYFTDDKK